MMQVPSSNHSTSTSRRSNTSRRNGSTLSKWLDGFIDKACCAASGYAVGDEVMDDNSIAFNENRSNNGNNMTTNNENLQASTGPSCINMSMDMGMNGSRSKSHHRSKRDDASVLWEAADESIQWLVDSKSNSNSKIKGSNNNGGRQYRHEFVMERTKTPTKRTTAMPQSPGSDATATTVLTGSSNSSRGDSPRVRVATARSEKHFRAHSTGNIRSPEDEWQQEQLELQREEERRIQAQLRVEKQNYKKSRTPTPREVLVPMNWTHEHGLRRIQSDTYRLPFQTVQPEQVYYRPNN